MAFLGKDFCSYVRSQHVNAFVSPSAQTDRSNAWVEISRNNEQHEQDTCGDPYVNIDLDIIGHYKHGP